MYRIPDQKRSSNNLPLIITKCRDEQRHSLNDLSRVSGFSSKTYCMVPHHKLLSKQIKKLETDIDEMRKNFNTEKTQMRMDFDHEIRKKDSIISELETQKIELVDENSNLLTSNKKLRQELSKLKAELFASKTEILHKEKAIAFLKTEITKQFGKKSDDRQNEINQLKKEILQLREKLKTVFVQEIQSSSQKFCEVCQEKDKALTAAFEAIEKRDKRLKEIDNRAKAMKQTVELQDVLVKKLEK